MSFLVPDFFSRQLARKRGQTKSFLDILYAIGYRFVRKAICKGLTLVFDGQVFDHASLLTKLKIVVLGTF